MDFLAKSFALVRREGDNLGIDVSQKKLSEHINQEKETNPMKKSIIKAYPKTEDALLVEKFTSTLGITDNYLGQLQLKVNAEAVLKEAKRLQALEDKDKSNA